MCSRHCLFLFEECPFREALCTESVQYLRVVEIIVPQGWLECLLHCTAETGIQMQQRHVLQCTAGMETQKGS